MKIWNLIQLFMFADVTTGGAVETKKPELNSPKLDELRAARKTAWAKMIGIEDGESDEAINAKMDLWKIDGEINAEKQALVKAENDAKVQELRNERLALNSKQFEAYDNLLKVNADKKSTDEQKADAKTAFETAKELVNNELLAKYAGSSSARKTTAKTSDNGQDDTSTDENKAKILDLYNAKRSHTEIETETGIPRSTVWHVIDKAIKAGTVVKWH